VLSSTHFKPCAGRRIPGVPHIVAAKLLFIGGSLMLLNAVMCVWNEEDIIESTVKHALAQGCSNVFIVDNGSTDRTVTNAVKAGGKPAAAFKTQYFDEDKKVAHLNATADYISSITSDEHIWWLFLDADEFPNFDCECSIIEMLNNIDSSIRAIHGAMYDHQPTHYPHHVSGYHPADFAPLCTVSPVGKVPLLRYDKGYPALWSIGGAHDFITHGSVVPVMRSSIHIHHFPYRNPEFTFSRLKRLVHRDDDGVSRIDWYDGFLKQVHKSPSSPSQYLSKYQGLHYVYTTCKDVIFKINSLPYDFNNITRWYDLNIKKDFPASDYEKCIHTAIYYYFLRQYDIALCRFNDALDICDNNIIKLWLMVKIAECFAESDIETAYNIIVDILNYNNSELNTYIKENLGYIINKSRQIRNAEKPVIYAEVDFHNTIFPSGIGERYKEMTEKIKRSLSQSGSGVQ
jgi:glycosyltransferase involved in cell wall biosynthesis